MARHNWIEFYVAGVSWYLQEKQRGITQAQNLGIYELEL